MFNDARKKLCVQQHKILFSQFRQLSTPYAWTTKILLREHATTKGRKSKQWPQLIMGRINVPLQNCECLLKNSIAVQVNKLTKNEITRVLLSWGGEYLQNGQLIQMSSTDITENQGSNRRIQITVMAGVRWWTLNNIDTHRTHKRSSIRLFTQIKWNGQLACCRASPVADFQKELQRLADSATDLSKSSS